MCVCLTLLWNIIESVETIIWLWYVSLHSFAITAKSLGGFSDRADSVDHLALQEQDTWIRRYECLSRYSAWVSTIFHNIIITSFWNHMRMNDVAKVPCIRGYHSYMRAHITIFYTVHDWPPFHFISLFEKAFVIKLGIKKSTCIRAYTLLSIWTSINISCNSHGYLHVTQYLCHF